MCVLGVFEFGNLFLQMMRIAPKNYVIRVSMAISITDPGSTLCVGCGSKSIVVRG